MLAAILRIILEQIDLTRLAGRICIAIDWLFAVRVPWPKSRESRRAERGECAACSYDLTGNVSGVCPECGTTIAKSAAELSN